MNIRYIVFALCFMLGSTVLPAVVPDRTAAAQEQGERSRLVGTVVDDATNETLATATVALWQTADSSLVTGTVTQDDGGFVLENVRPGRYYVQVSFVGFRTASLNNITVEPGAGTVELGEIPLRVDAQMMDNVEVTAERSFVEVGIDRTVYNTQDQLVSVGGNAADVLQNIPSVEVDIDGNVSLRGSQNVAILIDGRPSPLEGDALTSFLQGLPSDAIERVEVIPNPSAKYEPDGMSGILNIVLKKDRELGLSGSVNGGIATSNTYNASGNVNYQTGPWNLSTGYSFRTRTRDGGGSRYRENRFLDPITYLETDDSGDRTRLSHNVNLGVDYQFDEQNSLSLSTRLSNRGSDEESLTAYYELNNLRDLTARYDRRTLGEDADLDFDAELAFRRILDPSRHELTVEMEYEAEWEDEFERYEESVLSGNQQLLDTAELQTNDESERGQEGSLQIDYMQPLGEDGRLEAGYRGTMDRLDSRIYSESYDPEQGTFTPDLNINSRFTFDEQIHAVYGIVGGEIGRFGLQGGVRLEQALTTFNLSTTNEAFDNNYFSAFPSAFMTYEIQEGRTFKLSYSKRIDRPNTWQLNPFDSYDDPLFRRVGNPYLDPEYVHAFEASYTQFTGSTSLTLTPYFRRTVDVVRRYETVDENGVSTLTFENFDSSDSWGAEAIGTLEIGRWLRSYASLNGYRIVTDGGNINSNLSNNAFGYTARVNATVNIRPDLDMQVSFFYRSPIELEGGGRMNARSAADIALRQRFLDNRASLSVRMSDVFNTMNYSLWREDERFYQESTRQWDSQNIYLTFTYNFGKLNRDRDRDRNQQGGGDDVIDDIEFQ